MGGEAGGGGNGCEPFQPTAEPRRRRGGGGRWERAPAEGEREPHLASLTVGEVVQMCNPNECALDRRVVSHGDAWYPFGSNPKFRMDTVASYAARRDRLWKCAEEAGRNPATIALSYNCAFHNAEAQVHVDGGRQLVTGTPEQRAEDIAALGEAGISTMVVNVASNDKSEMLARMAEFSENVMPLVG